MSHGGAESAEGSVDAIGAAIGLGVSEKIGNLGANTGECRLKDYDRNFGFGGRDCGG